ncbi:hypothetical protein SAMN05192568_1011136 [Methylobacterium pseudosasicola]|uniref:Uncharacterized protein n=1 Tax=Methylobacterium pseudosasicola TaxID=582667 RepID=A0A1I4KTR9_9HYPH|nr:hypothetical protein SAMN05192568_1011136 [Methylobacterium pseudosasicola]
MPPFGLTLPLRIVADAEAVRVLDAADRVVALIAVHADRGRREVLKRLSPDGAAEAAKVIRQALTDSTVNCRDWD